MAKYKRKTKYNRQKFTRSGKKGAYRYRLRSHKAKRYKKKGRYCKLTPPCATSHYGYLSKKGHACCKRRWPKKFKKKPTGRWVHPHRKYAPS